jgi:hypothetical protein
MIALRNNLPLVEDVLGTAASFERAWLQSALEEAAAKAGVGGWWLAQDLAHSVTFYLENVYAKNVIASSQLESAVRLALREIGYDEVARHFSPAPPWCVSLLRCVSSQSVGGINDLFEELAERIEAFRQAKVLRFHFYDLQSCVRSLQHHDAETRGHEPPLRQRIVDFVREKINAGDWSHEIFCSIV